MQNVTFHIEGDHLVITVDLSQEVGESGSGKSMVIGTTSGNVAVPGCEDVKVGLNVYRPLQTSQGGSRMAGGRGRRNW